MWRQTRREFLAAPLVLPAAALLNGAEEQGAPWYRRTYRWGQTNISEQDPAQYDVQFWRAHWKRTRVQGVIINAGGIVAYYPSRYPLHHRAQYLGDRDLLGELTAAARQDGLAVFARMDSNRAHEAAWRQHPEWFARDDSGEPYRAGDLYVTCVNSAYYEDYIPSILREIVERTHPDGFTDNSWSGLDRDSICYCENCARAFRDHAGSAVPARKDWDDPAYRKWIEWNYLRRLELWDLNNRVTRAVGGPHCIWSGMVSGDLVSEGRRFRSLKAICERADIVMFDDQGRSNAAGFQANGDLGKRMHGLMGWDKLIAESMAMYQRIPTFRKAASPAPEARLWMLEGIAGGIQPWWHHVGAVQEDKRQFATAESICRWHEANQQYLVNRRPLASVGVVWSQQDVDFYGREDAERRAVLPYRGIMQTLVRDRIPYVPVHADHIERDAAALSLLILPNLGAMSDRHADAVRRFAAGGGAVVATGETSLYDEWGSRRDDFALGDVFGVNTTGEHEGPGFGAPAGHSYLRLSPDMGAGERHAILRGFEETNILPFGGTILKVRPAAGTAAPLTYIPEFPVYPPETSWMREPRTATPVLILRSGAGRGRVAYLAADIDGRFGRDNLPDHFRLLANIVRWAAADSLPLEVQGPGLVDCHLYEQPGRLLLHLVNLTNTAAWRAPVDELIPVGPLDVRIRLPKGLRPKAVRLLVKQTRVTPTPEGAWIRLQVPSLLDHELVLLE